MFHTRVCDLLGIEYAIVAAPLGPDLSGPELVAAVSNAGGLGILPGQPCPADSLREQIRRVRDLTARPFGVNFILPPASVQPLCEEALAVCLEEPVPIIYLAWGDPGPVVERVHAVGARLLHQVNSVEEAEAASRAGVDVVIAQGLEAGGRAAGELSTLALVPRVVDAIAPTPVLAAGGIADARGLVAVLALGAEGAVLGTRFVASTECDAHPVYKQNVVAAAEQDTVRTGLYGADWTDGPQRVLRTPFVARALAQADHPPLSGFPPNSAARGDVAAMSLPAGLGVGLIDEIKPAAAIVRDLVAGAERLIGELGGVLRPAGPATLLEEV